MSGTGTSTLYIAASVDGFIATEDGDVAWLDEFQQDAERDEDSYEDFFSEVDCLVVGSKTYEQVLEYGGWPYDDKATYVLTGRDLPRPTPAVELVDTDVRTLASRLKREHSRVWVVGGAQLAQTFLRVGGLDELRLNLVPVLLGSGISLFGNTGQRRRLDLLDVTTRKDGTVELHYEVES